MAVTDMGKESGRNDRETKKPLRRKSDKIKKNGGERRNEFLRESAKRIGSKYQGKAEKPNTR